ncbi:MAG: flagellar hook-basal body protein [Chloroflexi bacterium]|nr:flagellar hook-basal body protein [Chloroflexota bacterium]
MVQGIDTTTASLVSLQTRLMQLANNVANVDTPGYKQDVVELNDPAQANQSTYRLVSTSAGLQAEPVGSLGGILLAPEPPGLDLTAGIIKPTGGQLDLAIEGAGYFAVQRGDGIYYTRDGSFLRAADGSLVTSDGGLVLGSKGAIKLPDGEVKIDEVGNVWVAGKAIDKLRLDDFPAGVVLRKVGFNYLKPDDPSAAPVPATGAVYQGFIETSNVDIGKTMVEMMSMMRSYQANQRILQLQNEALAKAVNDVARLA